MVDKMRDREERKAAQAPTRAAKPVTGSAEERRLQEAIEDDEVREALRIPRRRKPVAKSGTKNGT
jgi:hypothetical protein